MGMPVQGAIENEYDFVAIERIWLNVNTPLLGSLIALA